jgi:hypothetical protein
MAIITPPGAAIGRGPKPCRLVGLGEGAEVQCVVMQYMLGLGSKSVVMVGVQVGLLDEQNVWVVFRDHGLNV